MSGKGIRIEGLKKRYGEGDTAVDALKGVDMQVAPGEVVGLIGPSGSGKSTLLKCLGAVIDPTAGRMTLGDEVIDDDGWEVRDLRALRRDRIGFVFQVAPTPSPRPGPCKAPPRSGSPCDGLGPGRLPPGRP